MPLVILGGVIRALAKNIAVVTRTHQKVTDIAVLELRSVSSGNMEEAGVGRKVNIFNKLCAIHI